jgi:hypothetical protein
MLLSGAALLVTVPAFGGTALYDNFGGGTINPKKWYPSPSDYLTLDAVRQVTPEHQLHLAATGYSSPQNDGGYTGNTFGLYFANPQSIVATAFSVTVNKAVAIACKSRPGAEVVTGPEFRGRFFNTQASPSSQLGDVEFAIGLDRRPSDINGLLAVSYIFQECANSSCSQRNTLGQAVIGHVQPGTSTRVAIGWDRNHHRFTYAINGKRGAIGYTVSDTSPAYDPEKQLDVAREIVDCGSWPRAQTSVDVSIDNVTVLE